MGQLKVYHFKTLWVTYLVWAVLVALAAARIVQVGNLPNARQGLLFWLLIHMGPLLTANVLWRSVFRIVSCDSGPTYPRYGCGFICSKFRRYYSSSVRH